MTLAQKVILRNALLVLGLLLLGGASLWGVFEMRRLLNIGLQEYDDLREVELVERRVFAVKGMIDAVEGPGPAGASIVTTAALELKAAGDLLARFMWKQDEQNSPNGADAREKAAAADVAADLEHGVQILSHIPADVPGCRESVAAALGRLSKLELDMDNIVDQTRKTAARDAQRAIISLGGLVAILTLSAIWLSILQYRNVIDPLDRLRTGVRALTAANFSQRFAETGEPEHRALAADFNRMAAELDSFYRELEHKVAVQSRELALSERLASVGYLAAGVAHEINNPLSIISGYAELSIKRLNRTSNDEDLREIERTLNVIRDEAFRCKEITRKLLELVRVRPDATEVLSIPELAREVADLVGGLKAFSDRRLTLRFDDSDRLRIDGNRNKLKQVLLNLVVNALEAVNPGTGVVSLEGRRVDGRIELIVRDNGRGMTSETLAHVFEPFFTAKRGAGEPGTGLGLSIAHAIVKNHEGTIHAESAGPGRGSAFFIQLPAIEEPSEISNERTL